MKIRITLKFLLFQVWVLLCVCATALSNEASAQASEKPPHNQVVAEANGKRITLAQLDAALSQQLGNQRLTLTDEQQHGLKQRVLERLVDRELLFAAAAQKKLVPSETEVDNFLNDLKQHEGGEQQLNTKLQEGGLNPPEFREGLRTDLAIRRYLDQEVFSKLQVSDEELERQIGQASGSAAQLEEAHVRQILIRVEPDASAEVVSSAEKRAQLIAEEARSGGEFAQLAREYSEAHNKGNGGDLGFITENQLDPEFSAAAFALKTGEVSNPVRTKFGFHIIKIEERRKAAQDNPAAMKLKLKESLLEKRREEALESELANLRKAGKIILYMK